MASSATIKAIESSTVHQIQSGQVIVDLCSVAKELVENSFDARATAIGTWLSLPKKAHARRAALVNKATPLADVRFKNQGLDSIEVQDNGLGIASHNYESIALKHYTSKLTSYDDLSELQTFGFRGEALSSLCALSRFAVVTCTAQDVPRASRLEFETSGKLKSTSVVSGQKGTTVIVEDLFHNLPVRRRELERNIKREWGKVINLLNQYACVQTGVKFTVSQQPTKGKRMVLFSTKGNPTTRENIINVFGVKTMNALILMDLKLELTPTAGPLNKGKAKASGSATEVRVLGHVSRPAHGEGRQTPDRQMFYVNGRPCGLPQFAKVFNEVYRSYNASQSPFIFADIQLDTHLYDVNVSPDKRTILLHDQGQMLDNLRESLIELFETQDVTIPVSQAQALKQNPFKTAAGRSWTLTSAQTSSRAATVESQRQAESSSSILRKQRVGEDDDVGDEEDDEEASEEGDDNEQPVKKQVPPKPRSSLQSASVLSRWLAKSPDDQRNSTVTPEAQQHASSVVDGNLGVEKDGDTAKKPGDEESASEEAEADNLDNEGPEIVESIARSTRSSERPREIPAEDDDQDARIELEPPIPAIAPSSQTPASRVVPKTTTRSLKRSTQEVATITIGDHTVTSLIGHSSKRPKVDEDPKPTRVTGPVKGGKRNTPLPSFGGRLTQLFSASAHADEGPVDKTGILADDIDEDMEESGEDVDEQMGGSDEDIDKQMEEAGEDIVENENEEGSLFVSQEDGSGRAVNEIDGETEKVRERFPVSGETESPVSSDSPDTPMESVEHTLSCHGDDATDDADYADEDEKKAQEEKVREMIDTAEATAETTEGGEKRSQLFVKGRSKRKDMTLNLEQQVKTSVDEIQQRIAALTRHIPPPQPGVSPNTSPDGLEAADAEEKLSLKISKTDFAKMRIVGQFNLGFVLAVREAAASPENTPEAADDELFIIDQHASDEKYNFERLQATTTVQSQRLVQPKTLDLTALEEEIILEHLPALERNGFVVQADTSGARPVGSRVQLLSLPLSRETTFSLGRPGGADLPAGATTRRRARRRCRGRAGCARCLPCAPAAAAS
ncbi:hypothetical protein CHGG_04545 [Chaetomium globosum CBS 148.51]|uniref:DNA mismatch repair protein S5 domain-containing protein n=1 Tax=Chaetomium globosum (strain ATCC 6205 / CBS 148.51 / DSM 1962 / NBRC 6347 / NRRL 1970) TaxID=306901 RepID=Q2H101_CHAGB|nr:uncharacterized protein CHGG_04545 [Chaetomium globosum CBS 148.51]EAQ87926.1 hypothetical protein CHGG_04545 [Chaetomium globosum CBS 148.51]